MQSLERGQARGPGRRDEDVVHYEPAGQLALVIMRPAQRGLARPGAHGIVRVGQAGRSQHVDHRAARPPAAHGHLLGQPVEVARHDRRPRGQEATIVPQRRQRIVDRGRWQPPRVGNPHAQQIEAAPARHGHGQVQRIPIRVAGVPGQRQLTEGEDAEPFVGVKADPVVGRAVGAPGGGPCAIRVGALLDNGHVGLQRQEPRELRTQRHVAVPGHDAQLDDRPPGVSGCRQEFQL